MAVGNPNANALVFAGKSPRPLPLLQRVLRGYSLDSLSVVYCRRIRLLHLDGGGIDSQLNCLKIMNYMVFLGMPVRVQLSHLTDLLVHWALVSQGRYSDTMYTHADYGLHSQ